MICRKLSLVVSLLFVPFVCTHLLAGEAPDIAWGVQLGSSGTDFPSEVAADADGNTYVVGETNGTIGAENLGRRDGFLVKYNAEGTLEWAHHIGTSTNDNTTGVEVDKNNDIIIVGNTSGDLGSESFGRQDGFICKFDKEGNLIWTSQFGSSKAENTRRVTLDSNGYYYVVGATADVIGEKSEGGYDVFVIKFDDQGNQQWATQFGTTGTDDGVDLVVDQTGFIYVVGKTGGSFDITNRGDEDAFLAKLDSEGKLVWVRQFGTSSRDRGRGIALCSSGNIYVGGWTGGTMGTRQYGNGDPFLALFDQDGNRLWTQQFGTNNWDGIHGMTTFKDGSGDVLVGGCWKWPNCHGWCRRYTSTGEFVWEKLIYKNTSKSSCGQTVYVDNDGNCYHIGGTDDSLFGDLIGVQDAFLVKLASPTGVDRKKFNHNIPEHFELHQNVPNPFNPTTDIKYSLMKGSQIRLVILNTAGQQVKTLVDDWQTSGHYSAMWDATDDNGKPVSSGLYVYQLFATNAMAKKKMLFIR